MPTHSLDETRRAYSVDDIAHAYGLSRQKVYDEINAGRLRSIKVGARRICTLPQLESWEQECSA